MNLKLLSGKSNAGLAKAIAEHIPQFASETVVWPHIELTPLFLKNFPSGESYCQIQDNIRGDDVFIINGITKPANENLMDTLIIADAARRASAGRITAVIPYFGYARQDRKDKSRVPISAKLVMDLLQASGIERVVTMDLHSPQIAGFTNLPFDHLAFEPVLLKQLTIFKKSVIVAPDVGAVKRAEHYSKKLNLPLALIVKNRLSESEVELQSFVGNVKGKTAIIVDDLTESCGTLIQAAKACKDNGATRVICAVTHACLTDEGQQRLTSAMETAYVNNLVIDEFIHSDTVDYSWNVPMSKPKNIKSISVAELFGQAISRIHDNKSVSCLFE